MERLFLSGVLGFVLGILLQDALSLTWIHVLHALFLSGVILLLFLWKRLVTFLLVATLLFGVMLGMARTEVVPRSLPAEFGWLLEESETTIEGVVVADPDLRETTQRLTVELREGDTTTKILVVAPLYPSVRYGETVRAKGEISAPEPFATVSGRTFSYDKFLAKDGIFVVMEDASIEVSGEREGTYYQLRGLLSDLKFSGIDALSRALPEPQASLAAGLILGGKQGLGEDLLNDFIRTGLVHIVVLSGYNVMIVAEFVMRVFGFLSTSTSASLGAITIGLFVLSAGAGPASLRAGLMAAIALYARATGRTYEAFRALLLAGVLMLVGNPLTLPYDPGFQLSFMATLGLLFGASITERWFSFVQSTFLREISASTVAAQIAVLPLLLYQNGLFSLVALPANILVLPLIPLTMLVSFLAMLTGWLIPFLAPVVGLPAHLLLSYVLAVAETASQLPLAALTIPSFPFAVTVLAYALLTWCVVAKTRSSATVLSRRS